MNATNSEGSEIDFIARSTQFVAEHVAPVEMELDARTDPEDCFSWEIFDAADAAGLRTMTVDKKWGGGGTDFLTFLRAAVELAKGDLGIAGMLVQTNRLSMMYQNAGTPEQVARFMPEIVNDPRCHLSFCTTEEGIGSESGYPVLSGPNMTRYKTRAVRRDGGWAITGKKIYIDCASIAKYYLVMAQTDDSVPTNKGATCFIVERGTKGLSSGKIFDKTGERLALHAEVLLDDCWVPDENVLGEVNGGSAMVHAFQSSRSLTAGATAVGVAEAAYECALNWAKERVQCGAALIEHDLIRADLARTRMMIDAAAAFVESAAKDEMGLGQGKPTSGIYPKLFAGEVAWNAAVFAVDIHGARGYTRGWRPEKLVRDAASFFHAGTPARTALLKASRILYGDPQTRGG